MKWWYLEVAAVIALIGACVAVGPIRSLCVRIFRAPRRLLSGMPLLFAVCMAVAGGIAVAALALWVLEQRIDTTGNHADPIDLYKLSLVVAGGVGGVVALVVAYRRQRDVEQGRFVERFGAAAAQLGDRDVAVRIAGVYAMAGVADESTGLRRQQCIDVLCGYIRLPYSPERGSNHQTKLVLKGTDTDPAGATVEQERHLEFRQNDKEVRTTIVRVIRDHLLKSAEYSWTRNDFDFEGAHLENVDFTSAVFAGVTQFTSVTFSGVTRFNLATFSSSVAFRHSSFSGLARFDEASFSRSAWFDGASFSGRAWFDRTSFSLPATFTGATFAAEAKFRGATFFRGASFAAARFTGGADFQATLIFGSARFEQATFIGDAAFQAASFSGSARFDKSTFSGAAWFDEANFSGDAKFDQATFSGNAQFSKVTFATGPAADFCNVDFGTGNIVFDNPRQWGPPAPLFDWDSGLPAKPANVTPHSWPPVPVP